MKTLAIIGSHPKTAKKFDFERTDCDIWMFNESLSGIDDPRAINDIKEPEEKEDSLRWAKRRADIIFQMHEESIWRNPKNRNDRNHFLWLEGIEGKCGVCNGKGYLDEKTSCNTCKRTGVYTPPKSRFETPIYMQEQFAEVPLSVKYPIDEIVERFKVRHFTSSVAYAMALAAYLGEYDKVEIYGVEMETNTEYQYQRDGVTLWIGVLLGLGIEVDAHIDMFNQPLYGYEGEVHLPYDVFGKRIEELEPHIALKEQAYTEAAKKTATAVDAFMEHDTSARITEALQEQFNLSQALGLLVGAKSENIRYQNKADTMREASGGEFVFSRQEFESSAKKLTDQAGDAQVLVNQLSGQGEVMHKQVQNAAKGSPKRKKILERYRNLMDDYLKAHNRAMIFTGGAKENYAFMDRLDKGIRAAGGSKSEAVLLEKAGQNAMVAG